MIDEPHFDHHSPSFAERIYLGIAALSAALLAISLVLMSFFLE